MITAEKNTSIGTEEAIMIPIEDKTDKEIREMDITTEKDDTIEEEKRIEIVNRQDKKITTTENIDSRETQKEIQAKLNIQEELI